MASRKEEKEQRRQERLEREKGEQQVVARRKKAGFAVLGLIVVAAVVVGVVLLVGRGGGDKEVPHSSTRKGTKPFKAQGIEPPALKTKNLVEAAEKAGCKDEKFKNQGREHLKPDEDPPKYKTNPPTSGKHDPVALEDGAYSQLDTDRGMAKSVHALEHGRVVVQYRGITEQQERQLKGLFDENDYHVVLIPNESDMPYQVAATAWARSLTCKKMDASSFDAIRAFSDKYVDQGPELVP